MNMNICLRLFLLALLAAGCTFQSDRSRPLKSPPYTAGLERHNVHLAVVFDQVIPDKPLPETVWDNPGTPWGSSSPFWDRRYSERVGFIRYYTDYFFYAKFETRVIVPFGRIFSDVLSSAASNACSSVQVAYDPAGAKRLASDGPPGMQVIVKLSRFSVVEEPKYQVNYSLDCHYQVIDRVKNVSRDYDLSRKTGPFSLEMGESAATVDEIDRRARAMAEDAATEILKNCGL